MYKEVTLQTILPDFTIKTCTQIPHKNIFGYCQTNI